jgi:hypothetical protein
LRQHGPHLPILCLKLLYPYLEGKKLVLRILSLTPKTHSARVGLAGNEEAKTAGATVRQREDG